MDLRLVAIPSLSIETSRDRLVGAKKKQWRKKNFVYMFG